MKKFSKKLAAVMAALMIASSATSAVNAAGLKSCGKISVVCKNGSCGGVENLLSKLCGGKGCNLNDIFKSFGGGCKDGNCTNGNCKDGSCTNGNCKDGSCTNGNCAGENCTNGSCADGNCSDGYCTDGSCFESKPSQPSANISQPAVEQISSDGFNSSYEAEVIRLVNNERAKYGLSALSADNGVTSVARLRSKEIVQSFSHTRPDGSSCFTAAKELGVSYRSAGENIAYGYPTPEKVVTGWMNSEGHRKNILSSSFGKLGVGCYKSGGVLYWAQFFTD